MRVFNFLLVGGLVALVYTIYGLKYESRALQQRVAEVKQSIRVERDAVAILRAEWSHLNRPKRIERLARKHLGLKPLKARQFLTARQYQALRQPSPAEVAARLLGRPEAQKTRRQAALQ